MRGINNLFGRVVRKFYRDYVPNLRADAKTIRQFVREGDRVLVRGPYIQNSAGQIMVENKYLADYLISRGKEGFEVAPQMLTVRGMTGFLRQGKLDLLKSPALLIPASLGVLDIAFKTMVDFGVRFESSSLSIVRELNYGTAYIQGEPFFIYFGNFLWLTASWMLYNVAQRFTSKLAAGIFVAGSCFKIGERVLRGSILDYIKMGNEALKFIWRNAGLGENVRVFDLGDAAMVVGLPLAAFVLLRFGFNLFFPSSTKQ